MGKQFNYCEKNFLLGTSLCSYKIESIPYEAKNRSDWKISKYIRYDFFQIAAEIGYLNMVVLFCCYFYSFISPLKKIIKKAATEKEKWIGFMIILTAIG